MILQSISIGLLFTGLILNNGNIIEGAAVILGIALIFAVVSAVLQLNTKIDNIFKFLNLEKSLQTLRNLLKKV